MSTITATAQVGHAGSDRLLSVVRLHFVNRWTAIYLPWAILGFIFLINLAVWAIIRASVPAGDRTDALNGTGWSGASFYFFVYMMVLAVQAINTTFPFAQGYGVTRRDFYLGSCIAFGVLAVGYGVAFTVLASLEDATGGWGLGGRMFTAFYFGEGDWYQRLFLFVVAFAFFLFVGAATAAAYVRWKATGMYVFFAALTLFIVGGAALVTYSGSWPAIGRWFAEVGPYGFAAWMLVPTVVAALVGYRILRRATPRS